MLTASARRTSVFIAMLLLASSLSGTVTAESDAEHAPRIILLLIYNDIEIGSVVNISAHIFDRGDYAESLNQSCTLRWGSNSTLLNISAPSTGHYLASFTINASMMNESSIRVGFTATIVGTELTEWEYIYIPHPAKPHFSARTYIDPTDFVRPGVMLNITVITEYGGKRVNCTVYGEGNWIDSLDFYQKETGTYFASVMTPDIGTLENIDVSTHANYNGLWKNTTKSIYVVGARIYFRYIDTGINGSAIVYAEGKCSALNGTIRTNGTILNFSTKSNRAFVNISYPGDVVMCEVYANMGKFIQKANFKKVIRSEENKEGLDISVTQYENDRSILDVKYNGSPYNGTVYAYAYNDTDVMYHSAEELARGSITLMLNASQDPDIIIDVPTNKGIESSRTWIRKSIPEKKDNIDSTLVINISHFQPGQVANITVYAPQYQESRCFYSAFAGFSTAPKEIFYDGEFEDNFRTKGMALGELEYDNGSYTGQWLVPDIFLPGEYVSFAIQLADRDSYTVGNPTNYVIMQLSNKDTNSDGGIGPTTGENDGGAENNNTGGNSTPDADAVEWNFPNTTYTYGTMIILATVIAIAATYYALFRKKE